MIRHRSLPICVCTLLALLAGTTVGRADPDSPASPASVHAAVPADSAVKPAAAPTGDEPGRQPPPAANPAPVAAESPVSLPVSPSEAPPASGAGPADKISEPDRTAKPAAAVHSIHDSHEEITGLQTLGTRLTEHGDWIAAEIAFRQIMASPRANRDDLANALIGLARLYRRQGSLTKAAAIYERFLKDYPADERVPDAMLEVGRTHRALGAHQLAFTRFYSVINSTLKLSAEGSEHYQMLAKTAQFEIAETHFQLGDFAEAGKFFSRLRLLDLAPADRARAHFKSAHALYLGGDLDGAVTTLHSYLEQWPHDENVPEARYLLSLSLRSLGRKQEALEAALQLLRSQQAAAEPKQWSYWQRRTGNQLANDFFQNGDTLNALLIYQGLAALSPEPGWRLPITYQIALCYERMRLYDRASTAYHAIIDNANPSAAETSAPEKIAAVDAPKAANPELIELARMATWRLGQLDWHEQTERQLSVIFTTGADPVPKAPPALHAVAPNIESNASSQPTPPIANDHLGNPAAPSSSL